MQIFEFELIEPTVSVSDAAIAPFPASARTLGHEPMEQEGLAFARPLSLAVPLHLFVSGAAASQAILH